MTNPSSNIRPIILGALLLGLIGCSGPEGPDCSDDTECGRGEICLSSGGLLFGSSYCAPLGDGDAGAANASTPDAGVDAGRVCSANTPPESACDGVDNNGDGVVDEGCLCPFAGSTAGVCGNAVLDCNGRCTEPANYEFEEVSCDGLDNDCDEAVDEGQPFLATRVAAGGAHSCALDTEGFAYCWGRNDKGQLGNGTTDSTALPTAVSLSVPLSEISAGAQHTCAVGAESGAIYCWGSNEFLQVSDGETAPASNPVRLDPLNEIPWTDVAAGRDYTCAIAAGTIHCWGRNDSAQTGQMPGEPVAIPTPIAMVDGLQFDEISAGREHACGKTTAGVAYCWGKSANDRLARTVAEEFGLPAEIQPPRPELNFKARFIAAGGDHSCASATVGVDPLDLDGIACAGANDRGQLGGTPRPDIIETGISGPIKNGELFSCAFEPGAGVNCWGANDVGQLGREPRESGAPGLVEDLFQDSGSRVTDLAAGHRHACAATTEGVKCWGDNEFGQLGSTIARPGTVGVACVAQ